jgi:hypothetical protein
MFVIIPPKFRNAQEQDFYKYYLQLIFTDVKCSHFFWEKNYLDEKERSKQF